MYLNETTGLVRQISNEADAQLIHLQDVLFLETMVHQLDEKIKNLDSEKTERKSELEQFKITSQPAVPEKPVPHTPEPIGIPFGSILLIWIIVAVLLFGREVLYIPIIAEIAEFVGYLAFPLAAIITVILIIAIIAMGSSESSMKREDKKAMAEYREDVKWYKGAYREYEENVAKEEKRYEKWEMANRREKQKALNQYRNYSQLLTETYSANIIPQPFRNLECVYYLYDYLSSSNQTLSEALVQANLESIKKEMKIIVQNQAQIIINQRTIIAQNEERIEISREIAENSRESLKYQQIISEHQKINNAYQSMQVEQNEESLRMQRREEIDRFLKQ